MRTFGSCPRSRVERAFRSSASRGATLAALVAAGVVATPSTGSAFTLTTTVADTPLSVTLDGFVEAYYSFVLQDPATNISNARLFASRHNSITVSAASFGLELRYGSAFAYVAPWFGLTPTTIYSGEPDAIGAGSVGPSDSTVWRYLREARAGFDVGRLTIDAGLFVSPIGIEGVATKDNWMWSSSWQNFLFPFYHFGARAQYETGDGYTLGFWVVNGFNGAVDTNDAKSIIVTAAGPIGAGQWQVLYYGGDERPDEKDLDLAWLHHFDAWISLPITDALEVAAQVDLGFEPNELGVAWYAAGSAYLRWALTDMVAVTVRGEVFREQTAEDQGVATASFFGLPVEWVAAGSVALEVRPVAQSAIRLEYRHDEADGDLFFGDTPLELTERRQDAFTLGLTVWM